MNSLNGSTRYTLHITTILKELYAVVIIKTLSAVYTTAMPK